VEFVINYDLPEVAENYVHRVGRTGRGDRRGVAISFCSTEERETLNEIENFLDAPVSVMTIGKADYEATIDLSPASGRNWETLMAEEAEYEAKRKKSKRK